MNSGSIPFNNYNSNYNNSFSYTNEKLKYDLDRYLCDLESKNLIKIKKSNDQWILYFKKNSDLSENSQKQK